MNVLNSCFVHQKAIFVSETIKPFSAASFSVRLKILSFQVDIIHSQNIDQRCTEASLTGLSYEVRTKPYQKLDERLDILRLLYPQRSLDYFAESTMPMSI